jgi:hypothetical protein
MNINPLLTCESKINTLLCGNNSTANLARKLCRDRALTA